tara:strand:+ start:191 stop:604 length:414 start_codon:yes stop_codon:yes gene_type:complete
MELTTSQRQSISNYKRIGIDIEVLDEGKLKITQTRLINGYLLNQKQLTERAWEVFPNWRVIPIVFSLDVHDINIDWIKNKMETYGIKRKDLIKQLAMDKTYVSRLFSKNIELSNPMKASFYYYFLTYELNRDLRAQI